MTSEQKILFKQGAEGRLFTIQYFGKPAILKERFKKKYRHEELDLRLTKERIRAEAKSILRCKNAGILVPAVYLVNLEDRHLIIENIINSETVSEKIQELSLSVTDDNKKALQEIATEMGSVIGKMHHNNIIHGDLTTSNILLKSESDGLWKLYLIDFGLSYTKSADEDKAVDLYVLERALTSKHNDINWFTDIVLKSYAKFNKSCEKVLKKFHEVRSRGRKRTMVG